MDEATLRNNVLRNPGDDVARGLLAVYLQDDADKPAEGRLLTLMMALSGGENITDLNVSTQRAQMVAEVNQIMKDNPNLSLNQDITTPEGNTVKLKVDKNGLFSVNISIVESGRGNLTLNTGPVVNIRDVFLLYPVEKLRVDRDSDEDGPAIGKKALEVLMDIAQGAKNLEFNELYMDRAMRHANFQDKNYPRLENLEFSERTHENYNHEAANKLLQMIKKSPRLANLSFHEWGFSQDAEELLALAKVASPNLKTVEFSGDCISGGHGDVIEAFVQNRSMPKLEKVIISGRFTAVEEEIDIKFERAAAGIIIKEGGAVDKEAERRAAGGKKGGRAKVDDGKKSREKPAKEEE